MNDDDWARGLLAEPGIGAEPPSKVDPALAVRRGRRRLWMRRSTVTAAAAVTGAAVLMVASLPLKAPGIPKGAESSPPLAFASTPVRETPVRETPVAPTRCVREPLENPVGATGSSVHGGERSGRYAVGVAHLSGGEDVPVLWDGRHPAVLAKPKSGSLQAMAVNSSGTVVLALQEESGVSSWIYRDGGFTELPGGYSAVGINTRGDVAGAWLDDKGIHPPVVWLAGDPTNRRELAGGDPGDGIVAAVGGIDDDGTVVGASASWGRYDNASPPPREASSRPVFWPADGSPARNLPMPPGFGPGGWALGIRSGLVVGHVARPDPDADRRGNRAVVWDLAAGTATLDDRLGYAGDVNPHGWVVGRASTEPPAPPVAVFAGTVVPLPMPSLGPDSGGAVSISDDGRVIVGSVRDLGPVRWICR